MFREEDDRYSFRSGPLAGVLEFEAQTALLAPWEAEPHRGVSLLTLLQFHAEAYLELVSDLHQLHGELSLIEMDKRSGQPTVAPLSEREIQDARVLFARIFRNCSEMGLRVSQKHAGELAEQSEWLASDLTGLEGNIRRELEDRLFVAIHPSLIEKFTNPRIGWESVVASFPDAIDDIEEMNKCFALCRYPASVFHSLLVVEHGLVALGTKLGVQDPKPGWDASCRKLEEIVRLGRDHNQTGLAFTFLEQLNASAQAMKHAWRNKVNHATGKPQVMIAGTTAEVAEEIITATRGFMRALAGVV